MSLAKLSCGNIKINAIYGLITAVLIEGSDIIHVSLFYTVIVPVHHTYVLLSSPKSQPSSISLLTTLGDATYLTMSTF